MGEAKELTYREGSLNIRIWANYRMERLAYSLGARIETQNGVYYVDRHNVSTSAPSIGQLFEFAAVLVDHERGKSGHNG